MNKEIVLNNRPAVEKTASNSLYVVKNELYVPEKNIVIAHSMNDVVNLVKNNNGGFRL